MYVEGDPVEEHALSPHNSQLFSRTVWVDKRAPVPAEERVRLGRWLA